MPNLDGWDIGPRSVQTMVSLLKWLATNAINWDIGWHSALRTQEPQGQAPRLHSWWFNRTEVAHSSQPTWIAIIGLEPRVQLNVAGRSENFLFDTRATYSVLTSCSRAFSSQTCTILVATGKIIRKRFTWALCCWDGQIFSHQFLVVPECPAPSLGRDLSLPLKSCRYCSPDRRCFKTLFWGQTIFTSHQVKQLLNARSHLWMSDDRILRYQVVLIKNPGLIISFCEVLNPATLLPTPEGSLPFTLS